MEEESWDTADGYTHTSILGRVVTSKQRKTLADLRGAPTAAEKAKEQYAHLNMSLNTVSRDYIDQADRLTAEMEIMFGFGARPRPTSVNNAVGRIEEIIEFISSGKALETAKREAVEVAKEELKRNAECI